MSAVSLAPCSICKQDHPLRACPHLTGDARRLLWQGEAQAEDAPLSSSARAEMRETCLTALSELLAECRAETPSPVTIGECAGTVACSAWTEHRVTAWRVVRCAKAAVGLLELEEGDFAPLTRLSVSVAALRELAGAVVVYREVLGNSAERLRGERAP